MRLRCVHFIRTSGGEAPPGPAGVLGVGGPQAPCGTTWRASGEAGSVASPSLRYEEPVCTQSLLGEGGGSGRLVRHKGWAATVGDGRCIAWIVTLGLPSQPPALGSLLGFCLLHVREGGGRGGRNSQLFKILGPRAIDSCQPSLWSTGAVCGGRGSQHGPGQADCFNQRFKWLPHANTCKKKAELRGRLHPPGTPQAPSGMGMLQGTGVLFSHLGWFLVAAWTIRLPWRWTPGTPPFKNFRSSGLMI